jgi:hypothetical protein
MDRKQLLLTRLRLIAKSLEQTKDGLAVFSTGSVGIELDRMDEYSDLDFFVIVRKGAKRRFFENLDWLIAVAPVGYYFQNTADGYKLLFEDGVFCEFAVFEPDELPGLLFSEGRIVWHAADFDPAILTSNIGPPRPAFEETIAWKLGEALTNLYIGLARYHRGEKLSAARFIQGYAIERLLELAPHIEHELNVHHDTFDNDRRFEQRFPHIAAHLKDFMQGYEKSPQSARAILQYLEQHFEINPFIKNSIKELC